MLIEQYEVKVVSPPCEPGSERWTAFAALSADISEVLPYLNATLKGAIYEHNAQVLSWRAGGRRIMFRPHEIAVSNLQDRSEAEVVVQRMVKLVNRTWEERERIQPSLAKREPLRALDVYKLLPRTNCKGCGQPTCFTFALRLVAGQADIAACAPLFDEDHRAMREQLSSLMEAAEGGIEAAANGDGRAERHGLPDS